MLGEAWILAKHDIFEVHPFDTRQDRDWSAMTRQDDSLFLRLRDQAAELGLSLSNTDESHRISPVVRRPLTRILLMRISPDAGMMSKKTLKTPDAQSKELSSVREVQLLDPPAENQRWSRQVPFHGADDHRPIVGSQSLEFKKRLPCELDLEHSRCSVYASLLPVNPRPLPGTS